MRWILCLVLIFSSSVGSAAIAFPQTQEGGVRPFVSTKLSDFEWWVDSQTKKVNFRRCDLIGRVWVCRSPMLLRGLDRQDLPKLLDYYEESLAKSGEGRLYQFIKVLTGSFGTATAYAGALAAVTVLKDAMPTSLFAGLTSSWPVMGSIHLLSLGTLGFLLYFTGESLMHLHRQKMILSEYRAAIEKGPRVPPQVHLESQALFKEFTLTFRRALYEFTHGGRGFDDNGNLVFQ